MAWRPIGIGHQAMNYQQCSSSWLHSAKSDSSWLRFGSTESSCGYACVPESSIVFSNSLQVYVMTLYLIESLPVHNNSYCAACTMCMHNDNSDLRLQICDCWSWVAEAPQRFLPVYLYQYNFSCLYLTESISQWTYCEGDYGRYLTKLM